MSKKSEIAKGFSKTNIAREYRDKYGMEMPSLKLARIMHSNDPLLFTSVDNARRILRSIEGKTKNGTKPTHKYEERPKNPYNLPGADENDFTPVKITGHKKVGVISDIHVPYHSLSALTAAIDRFISQGIDALLINGDCIDFYGLSRFQKDPRKRNFAEELEVFEQLINSLKQYLKCKIYFKLGNHEERYDHYLMMKAHELIGVPEFDLKEVIRRRTGEDVGIIADKKIIHLNALDVIHGHEFGAGFFSPVNVARGLSLRAKTNAMQGHNHQVSEHTETNLRGEIKTTWSIGCNCDLHPDYLPINKWSHGFAIVEIDNTSDAFHVINYRVKNGKVL